MQQGSLEAQNNLAECYKYGNGCAKNPRRAFLYFKQIAEKGYAEAQNNFALHPAPYHILLPFYTELLHSLLPQIFYTRLIPHTDFLL